MHKSFKIYLSLLFILSLNSCFRTFETAYLNDSSGENGGSIVDPSTPCIINEIRIYNPTPGQDTLIDQFSLDIEVKSKTPLGQVTITTPQTTYRDPFALSPETYATFLSKNVYLSNAGGFTSDNKNYQVSVEVLDQSSSRIMLSNYVLSLGVLSSHVIVSPPPKPATGDRWNGVMTITFKASGAKGKSVLIRNMTDGLETTLSVNASASDVSVSLDIQTITTGLVGMPHTEKVFSITAESINGAHKIIDVTI
ncbi:MAG: hypothetical protein ACRCS8_00850 [Brevinema sp.]